MPINHLIINFSTEAFVSPSRPSVPETQRVVILTINLFWNTVRHFIFRTHGKHYNKEAFVKHEKANTAPIRRGVEYFLYAHVIKNQNFDQLPVILHSKPFHLNLKPSIYDLPFKSAIPYELMIRKIMFFFLGILAEFDQLLVTN